MPIKLSVERQTNVGRLCKITEWGTFSDETDIQTPAYLTYTRFGHIPHITWDVAENELSLKQKQIYQLTLASFFEALEAIEKTATYEGVASFCCMPLNSIRHLSLHDPLAKIPEGFNNNKSMAIWSGKAGRRSIEPENFIKILKTCKPHSFTTLWDYDTPFNVQKKRHGKSFYRSSEWDMALFEKNHTIFEEPGFLPLAGGISKESRIAFAKYFGPKPYANGFLIDLYHFSHGENIQNKSEFEADIVSDLISDVTLLIQQDVPRLVEGAFDPYQILCLVKNGCDLFDSSYTVLLAEKGIGFNVAEDYAKTGTFSVVDFTEEKNKTDMTPLCSRCSCYTCKTFKRAYLHHLIACKEMLGFTLLIIHNMTEFDRMFEMIRAHLAQ
uniref:tRNA-guanine(15) transglycosylase-like domain-containing protein n=1 Tax=Panagrolaimus superbus TaxID=310955 RepID=A0A914Y1A2_9BILA